MYWRFNKYYKDYEITHPISHYDIGHLLCDQEDRDQQNPVIWRMPQSIFNDQELHWQVEWEPNELNRTQLFSGSIDSHAYLLDHYYIQRQVEIPFDVREPWDFRNESLSWHHDQFTNNTDYGFISSLFSSPLKNSTKEYNDFLKETKGDWGVNETTK